MAKIFVIEYLGLWSPIEGNVLVFNHFCALLAYALPNRLSGATFISVEEFWVVIFQDWYNSINQSFILPKVIEGMNWRIFSS